MPVDKAHERDKRLDAEKGAVQGRRHDSHKGELKGSEVGACIDGGGEGDETTYGLSYLGGLVFCEG
jgi:hypothetical protein